MRTKRGGFRAGKPKVGVPRVKIGGAVRGGGAVKAAPWKPGEELDAGLKRYIRFPLHGKA